MCNPRHLDEANEQQLEPKTVMKPSGCANTAVVMIEATAHVGEYAVVKISRT